MPVYGIYRMILEVVGHDQTGSLFKRITAGFGSIMQYATAIVGAMIFERIATGIAQVVSASIEAVAYMQQMDVALTQLSARELVQSGQAASIADAWDKASVMGDKLLVRLQDMAILSPYTVESVTQTYRMAVAFGYTTDEAMTFTDALLENAAGIGADNSMLDRMAYNLAQVRLQGKVTALDVRQLALAGFDLNSVLKYVGKQMGVTIEDHLDFNEAIKSGKITWADFTKYYKKYADENFGGASERMARTLVGLKSTFHDVFVLTMPMLFGPAAQVVTDFLNGILDKFIGFRKSGQLEAWSKDIEAWTKRAIGSIQLLFTKGISSKVKIASLIDVFFPKIKDPAKAAESLVNVWSFITKAWGVGVAIVSNIIDNLKNVFAGLQTFWATNGEQILKVVSKLFGGIADEAMGKGTTWIDLVMTPLQAFVNWLNKNGPKIVSVLGRVATFITDILLPAVTRVLTFFSNNWTSILLFFGAFKIGLGIMTKVMMVVKTVSLVLGMLSSPLTLIIGLVSLLAVAWMNNWGDIRGKAAEAWTQLQPIFQQIGTWLQVNLPIAIQWLSTTWTTILWPAIQRVWAWMSTVLIPWFSGVLWPWLQTNIPAAIQTLSNFWNNVLLPVMQVVVGFFTQYLIPGFMVGANILSTVVGGAIQVLSALWNGMLLPALQAVQSFVQTYLMPIWTQVADVIGSLVGNALNIISSIFSTVLMPAIRGVWDIISNYLMPVWREVFAIVSILIGIVGQVFAAAWEKYLAPAIGKVYTVLAELIMPILTAVRDFVVNEIGPKIIWFHEKVIAPLVAALQGGLKDALEWFHGILIKIKDFLSGFELPDWLQGHSPSPFEMTLVGINEQLDILSGKRMPNLNAMFRGLPSINPAGNIGMATTGVGGNGLTVQVNVDKISNEVDVDRMAYKIARTIQRQRGNG